MCRSASAVITAGITACGGALVFACAMGDVAAGLLSLPAAHDPLPQHLDIMLTRVTLLLLF
jgi:hypothetical protein